jgi:hypothetical protein
MRFALTLLSVSLLLTGCEERSAPDAEVRAPTTEAETEPALVTATEPNEVLMLDVGALLQATAEEGDEVYGIRRAGAGEAWRLLNGGAVDEAFVEQWLGRFTPLEGDARYPDLVADSVMSGVTHRLVFRFTDGSGRTLAMERRADGLAVVSQSNGPVFRLPADRLDDLVPTPEDLQAE